MFFLSYLFQINNVPSPHFFPKMINLGVGFFQPHGLRLCRLHLSAKIQQTAVFLPISVISTKMKECLFCQFHSVLAFFKKDCCLLCFTE